MAGWLASLARVHRPGDDGRVRIAGRSIYVLPTKFGLLYLVLVLALLVGAINYANNPAFLLTFMLTGVGLATLLQTWRNLQGLVLVRAGERPDFAGGRVAFRYRIEELHGRDRPALQLVLADSDARLLDLEARGRAGVWLQRDAPRRGRCPAGRLTVSSRYPLGLVRAWCYVDSDAWVPVWPRPAQAAAPRRTAAGQGGDGGREAGAEDFVGLREYRPGDPPRHIDWKALAGERGLLTKQFASGGGEPLWMDWEEWTYLAPEARLSRLCRDVLDAHHGGRPYGLRLPGRVLGPAQGETHRQACLNALALYGEEGP